MLSNIYLKVYEFVLFKVDGVFFLMRGKITLCASTSITTNMLSGKKRVHDTVEEGVVMPQPPLLQNKSSGIYANYTNQVFRRENFKKKCLRRQCLRPPRRFFFHSQLPLFKVHCNERGFCISSFIFFFCVIKH